MKVPKHKFALISESKFCYRISKKKKMKKIKETEIVVLTVDLPNSELKTGDIGTVAMCHKNNSAFEVEFVTFSGETIAVETLSQSQIRPVSVNEIPHVRLVKVA